MSTPTLPIQTPANSWKDGKRHLWLLGLIVPLFPAFSALTAFATGSEWGWWFTPVVLYGVIPLLDHWIGGDPHNPPEQVVRELAMDKYYKWCVYAFIPLQFASLFLGMYWLVNADMGWVGTIGLLMSVGIVSGVAFNTAHELGHKREELDRWLSKLALAPTAYGHFFVEHNRGHHARVATPEDPASAKYGESYYAFLPRSV
ncbi:MAG: fatty acid desaturase, partial [Limnobacter sp.]|nr:fatty acid desaturase [Limnobacter sp.]